MKRLPIILAGASLLVGSITVCAQTQPLPKEPGATEQTPGEGSQKQTRPKEGQGNRPNNGERAQSGQTDQPEGKNKQEHQRGEKEQKSGDSSSGDTGKQKRDQAGGDHQGASPQENQRAQQGGDEPKGQKSQQRHAGKKLEAKQRTVVKEAIVKENVHPAKINFSIHVGAAVPRTVILYDLPISIIEYEPSYAHYKFILADDDTILVIDPETWTVVDVIEI